MKQGNWKENLQALSGIAVSSTKYDRACLTRAIRTVAFQDNPEPSDPGENKTTLLKKKYKRACKKWVKVEDKAKKTNNKTAYELILKHCASSMKMKLRLTADFQ